MNSCSLKINFASEEPKFLTAIPGNLQTLNACISELYGAPSWLLEYLDLEGDYIILATDDDFYCFEEYVKKNKLNVIELKISHKDLKLSSVEETPLVKHPALCNNCQQQIFGIRYKCTCCKDYDLCEKCEDSSFKDHHHIFFKIRDSQHMTFSWKKAYAEFLY